jgi:glycosyltransferase involved in cell wall biosynthesis
MGGIKQQPDNSHAYGSMSSGDPPLFYIVDWLPPDFGAVGQYALIASREIASTGRMVFLVGLTSGPSREERELHDNGGLLQITRVATAPYDKTRNIQRLLWSFRANFSLVRAVLRNPRSRNADVLFTGAPPFLLFFVIALKWLRKARLIYRITDFYPEVIIAARDKRNLVLQLLERITWFLRRRVDAFEALGEDQKQVLMRGGIKPSRITVKRYHSPIPNLQTATRAAPPPSLREKKIILYSGNYGVAHEVDTVIKGLIRHHQDGSAEFGLWLNATGQHADLVEDGLRTAGVPHARSRPVPLDQLASVLAAADVHLITLRSSFAGIVLPSKVHACIATGRPIIFVGPESSDVHLLCSQSEGLTYFRVEPGDSIGFANALEQVILATKQAARDSRFVPMSN